MKRAKTKVECEIRDCAYNMNGFCHADSVTIGDHGTPMCDTFCLSAIQGGSSIQWSPSPITLRIDISSVGNK
jgi:hypothetical protein